MSQMPKVIFVCLGNICRSPLAEAIFIKKLESWSSNNQLEGVNVISAATSDWNIGDGADDRAVQVALKYEYTSISQHCAKKLSNSHLDPINCTMIICMDQSNKQNVHRIIENSRDSESVSVHLFSDFGEEIGTEVPDPYYGDVEDFEKVLIQCEKYSDELLQHIHDNIRGG